MNTFNCKYLKMNDETKTMNVNGTQADIDACTLPVCMRVYVCFYSLFVAVSLEAAFYVAVLISICFSHNVTT